jgi:hypothetical protein
MIKTLQAGGPLPEYEEKLMLFGRLVGSWDIVGRFLDVSATRPFAGKDTSRRTKARAGFARRKSSSDAGLRARSDEDV